MHYYYYTYTNTQLILKNYLHDIKNKIDLLKIILYYIYIQLLIEAAKNSSQPKHSKDIKHV